jgi:hypothetical protein
MRQWLDQRQMHGKEVIEQISQADPTSLGDQPEKGGIGCERPRSLTAGGDLELIFLGSVDDLLVDPPGRRPVSDDQAPRARPASRHDRDKLAWHQASDNHIRLQVL